MQKLLKTVSEAFDSIQEIEVKDEKIKQGMDILISEMDSLLKQLKIAGSTSRMIKKGIFDKQIHKIIGNSFNKNQWAIINWIIGNSFNKNQWAIINWILYERLPEAMRLDLRLSKLPAADCANETHLLVSETLRKLASKLEPVFPAATPQQIEYMAYHINQHATWIERSVAQCAAA